VWPIPFVFGKISTLRALNGSALQTARANVHAARDAIDDDVHLLDVGALAVEGATRNLRTRDLDLSAKEHVFFTNLTFSHMLLLINAGSERR
jgi:hypothetical protein